MVHTVGHITPLIKIHPGLQVTIYFWALRGGLLFGVIPTQIIKQMKQMNTVSLDWEGAPPFESIFDLLDPLGVIKGEGGG